MQWETVIGLEMHVQLQTKSKLFCGDKLYAAEWWEKRVLGTNFHAQINSSFLLNISDIEIFRQKYSLRP